MKILKPETKYCKCGCGQKISEDKFFRKGHAAKLNPPWKGKRLPESMRKKIGESQKGRIISEEQKRNHSERMSGKNHPFYGKKRPEHSRKMKGKNNPMYRTNSCSNWNQEDDIGYASFHKRIRAERGEPKCCEFCGKVDKETAYEWASMTGDYANMNDYKSLCISCHRKYDYHKIKEKKMKKKYIDRKFNKKTLDIIGKANSIIEEYQAKGYILTLRQLYYQFVARDIIPNKTRDIKERLRMFAEYEIIIDVDVDRIALNIDQIEEYSPPPNPAKMTDSRYTEYVSRYGSESWELDALNPDVLSNLIQDAIDRYTDYSLIEKRKAVEKRNKNKLISLIDQL